MLQSHMGIEVLQQLSVIVSYQRKRSGSWYNSLWQEKMKTDL
jgi:hypothetical protein